ncbi:MAG: 16S rRNA (cytosine(1402)-N(4))-methyltransferase RsmH [Hyphomonadaceae bacterium]|nr:16S rRNA (cytosine(1402)-N(4))-methyltransferase RsmH [Hyphomonadaceae bacterium]
MAHIPVLLNEVVKALAPVDGEVYLDGTFGGGGYARAILAAAKCTLLGVDRDLDAIVRAEAMAEELPGLVPLLGRFGDLDTLAYEASYTVLNGIVLDLGVSSFQIDEPERGFSFQKDGPLDMRMGRSGPSAADVVNQMGEKDLAAILWRLGDEKASRRIARAIVERRKSVSFSSTLDLADLISDAVGGRKGARTHPATRSFQAIRIYVNDELGELARALTAAESMLVPGGRLVIVTFHSLEDRMVKQFFRERAGQQGAGSRHLPGKAVGPEPSFELITRKAVEPGEVELNANPRARSSRLRAVRRTEAPAWDVPAEAALNLPPLANLEVSG